MCFPVVMRQLFLKSFLLSERGLLISSFWNSLSAMVALVIQPVVEFSLKLDGLLESNKGICSTDFHYEA